MAPTQPSNESMKRFEIQPGPTHCVMRRGASWFAMPAEAVGEVLFRPPLVVVPQSDPVLAGLCHVRSEFFPVLRLDPLMIDDLSALPPERQMAIIDSNNAPWALLVDQVSALASLEMSAAPEADVSESWSEAVIGWATYESNVVRVLDTQRFRSLAEKALWKVGRQRERWPSVRRMLGKPRQIGL